MIISLSDPGDERVRLIIALHLAEMNATAPPDSVHALGVDELRNAEISFYVGEVDDKVVTCGALKHLGADEGELKSMRTIEQMRGRGLAGVMLDHLIGVARSRGYLAIRLETGAGDYFEPARRLYSRYGFITGEPFADYLTDPNSVYMHLRLGP